MDNFAFIIHPIDPKRDVERQYPLLGKYLPVSVLNFLSGHWPPVYVSHITGITSAATGKEIEGWLVACPFTPQRMMTLPQTKVYRKIIQTGKLAERLGARLLGLGAFTSVVGDAGVTISRGLTIPVTTGDSYAVAVAVAATQEAARQMDINLQNATAAVVGATGAIGSASAELLAEDVAQVILIGRRPERLRQVQAKVEAAGAKAIVATEMSALRQADLVITVTSAIDAIIAPGDLKSGSVVCDVARPRDVSRAVVEQRDDVLVIDGGMVETPGAERVDFHFDFGYPPRMAYACMAETITLALEGRYESFTLGREIQVARVKEIAALAERHGFRLGGFRSFERAVDKAEIERIRDNARRQARRATVTGA